MAILIETISKLYSKLENHHHEPELLSASLQAFRSDVSNCLTQLSLNSKPTSRIPYSFPWIRQFFHAIPIIFKAFSNLLIDIDYPITSWEYNSADEFLKYTFNLLQLFNSISSSLSHLGQSRLLLSHALTQLEKSPSLALQKLKPIKPRKFNKGFKENDGKEISTRLRKELVIHDAQMIMEGVGFWVSGIVISGLYGDSDSKASLEMRKLATKLVDSNLFERLDSSICEDISENGRTVKEIKEVNDAVVFLGNDLISGKSGDAAEELQRRLKILEKEVDGFGKEVDSVFSHVLDARSQLLDTLRFNKK